jgi:hypothetical protein
MRDAKVPVEVVYKGKVYIMSIQATDLDPILTKPKRKAPAQIRQIDTEVCPECGSLMFNRVCMNRQCKNSGGRISQAENALQSLPAPKQK